MRVGFQKMANFMFLGLNSSSQFPLDVKDTATREVNINLSLTEVEVNCPEEVLVNWAWEAAFHLRLL